MLLLLFFRSNRNIATVEQRGRLLRIHLRDPRKIMQSQSGQVGVVIIVLHHL